MYLIKVSPMYKYVGGSSLELAQPQYAIVGDPMRAVARFNALRLQLTNEAPVDIIGTNMQAGGDGHDYRIELNEYTLQECIELQQANVLFYEWSETIIF